MIGEKYMASISDGVAEKAQEYLAQAEAEHDKGNFQEMERLAREALEIVAQMKEGMSSATMLRARALRRLSESLWCRGMTKMALPIAEEALAAAINAQDRSEEAKAFGNIGVVCKDVADYPRALEYYCKALVINEELGDKSGVASMTGNIGLVYKELSDYPRALEYYHKALVINEELGNKSRVAINTGNIGSVYKELSDYPRALEYYHKALAINEELGNKSRVAITTSNIGPVYRHLSDYPRALEYFHKALVLFEELGNKKGVAANIGNTGNVYADISDYPRALECFRKALALAEEIGNKSRVVIWTGNIGNVYYYLSDYPRALKYMQRALVMDEELGNKSGVARHIGNIGALYAKEEFEGYDCAKAEQYLLQAKTMNEELGTKGENIFVLETLADIYERQELWKKFGQYYKQYHALVKEVQSEKVKKQAQLMEHRRKIAEMEHQWELERLNAEAERREMEQALRHQREELERSAGQLVQKNRFLTEITVDVRAIGNYARVEGSLKADELVEKIRRNIGSMESLGALEQQMNGVHREFIARIQEQYPGLTPMEVKIATLLRMNLTSPNIASLLFISPRTVELHRARIRRKMGLGAKENVYLALGEL